MMEKVAAGQDRARARCHTRRGARRRFGVTGMRIRSMTSDDTREIALKGVFIAIGHKPNTDIFEGQLEMEGGYHHDRRPRGQCHRDQHTRNLCGRGCPGPYLPAGRYQCRNRLHGGARCRALPGFAQARLSASMPRRPPHARTLPASPGRRVERGGGFDALKDLRGTLPASSITGKSGKGKPEATNRQAEAPRRRSPKTIYRSSRALDDATPLRPANRVVLEPPKPAPLPRTRVSGANQAQAHKHGPSRRRRRIPVRDAGCAADQGHRPARPPRAGSPPHAGDGPAAEIPPFSARTMLEHLPSGVAADDPKALLDWALQGTRPLKADNRAVVSTPPAAPHLCSGKRTIDRCSPKPRNPSQPRRSPRHRG